jgi:hypothetical protein
MTEKPKKKQCATEGCRKFRSIDSDSQLCAACSKRLEEEEDPFFGVSRLTEAEAEKWGRLDAEIRNLLLSSEIKQLESKLAEYEESKRQSIALIKEQELKQNYHNYQKINQQTRKELLEQIRTLRREYEILTIALSKKYNVDLNTMSIDPDTRVIRSVDC